MDDIYGEEQGIYDKAVSFSSQLQSDATVEKADYDKIVKEYGRLLKQLRRQTKLSDRATNELGASKNDLLDKVNIDALTGIYNRRFMEDNLKRIVKSISRAKGVLSVLMLDVDFFKRYNDTYGHGEGDTCLIAVAETIKESLARPDDFVARYGGEEFVAVLPNTDEMGARFVAGKIVENIKAKNIPHKNNDAADCVTISIGVVSGNVTHTQSGDDYVKLADKALYMSKENGRNRYTYIHLEEGE